MRDVLIIFSVCIAFFLLGWYYGSQKEEKPLRSNLKEVARLKEVIDSLSNVKDTLILKEYETRIKWRTKVVTDSIYIDNAHDTMQPIIRANLRKRYRNLREGKRLQE